MAEIKASDYLGSLDTFLGKVAESRLASKQELEGVRADLTKQVRDDAKAGANALGTVQVGTTKVLIPNSANLKALNLGSQRSRERMSNFKLNYLNRDQVSQLTNLNSTPEDTSKFIRHSRRLARHAREFLKEIQELEPDLEEEVSETLMQLEDNDMDLLKLEIKSFTRMRETLVRAVQGRKSKETVLKELDAWDINRNLWNLSLLEHPKATVQGMLANSAEVMGARATKTISELPKRSLVLAAPQPDAVERMTPASRTASVSWRLFTAEDLDKKFEKIGTGRQASPTSWRGLGLAPNTAEWYMPVPPEIAVGLRPLVAARRAALLAMLVDRDPL